MTRLIFKYDIYVRHLLYLFTIWKLEVVSVGKQIGKGPILGKDQYTVFFVRVIVICDTPHYVDWISVLCRCALISKSEV